MQVKAKLNGVNYLIYAKILEGISVLWFSYIVFLHMSYLHAQNHVYK